MIRLLAFVACAPLAVAANAQPAARRLPPVPLSGIPAAWKTPIAPFRIVGDIYYVGTRGIAAYLIRTRQGAILIDGTLEETADLVEHSIAALGVPMGQVKLLLSSHAHYDHVAGLAQLKADSGARLVTSAADRGAMESGHPVGDNPTATEFPAAKVDRTVRDGDTVQLGGSVLTARLTPGHTPGCTTWTMTVRERGRPLRVAFLCSLTVAANVLVGNRTYPGIVADYRRSFARMKAMSADVVLPSHPEVADVLGRRTRRDRGDANAFVDPALLGKIAAAAEQAFEAEFAKVR